jgi:hypothetical protein
MGDIRCFTRMPASDASVQFSRSPALATQTPFSGTTLQSMTSTNSFYAPITASFTGSVGIVTVSVAAGFTGNLKCSVFNDSAGNPGTVVASGPTITNPTTGVNTYTFSTPFAVTKSAAYWIAFVADGSYSNVLFTTNSAVGKYSAFVSYAAFPTATPTMSGGNNAVICSWSINTTNNALVSEPQQDGTTSYVYDSTPGDADFYNIGTIASTPLATVAVTTRGFMQKSDAGTRTAAVQIKSGGTTVASPTATLSSNFGWVWRTDSTDPATGTAWSATGVNNATIGPRTVA